MDDVFDPFGDYQINGYLRNNQKETDLIIVKTLEQMVFEQNIDKAINYIAKVTTITDKNLFQVHKILFKDLYPWAGTDRYSLESQKQIQKNTIILKGSLAFLPADRIHNSLQYIFKSASSSKNMLNKPGTILGELALAHPFLDGNGRTFLIVFNELCRRANFSIDWSKTNKQDYLTSLTEEIKNPTKNSLNIYLLQFKTTVMSKKEIKTSIQTIRGLDSSDRIKTIKKP